MFKEYRKKRGYTQEYLAELLQMSWRQVQRIENETSIPTLETFKKLVKILTEARHNPDLKQKLIDTKSAKDQCGADPC